MTQEELEAKVRSLWHTMDAARKLIPTSMGAEKRYGQAYQALVNLGVEPQLNRLKYRQPGEAKKVHHK